MDLSIIVVTYNASGDIATCLEAASMLNNLAIDVEVLVIDNDSRDGTVATVRSEFPAARVVENGENRGFAAAVNQAIPASHGEFLLLLNPDTAVLPGTIERMYHYLEAHPECGIVGGHLLNEDGSPQESITPFPTPWRLFQESLFVKRFARKVWDPSVPSEVDAVVGACLMVRRETILDIGGLDESYFLYSEEVDWCLRARESGWSVMYLPEAMAKHGLSRGSADNPGLAFVELYRSKIHYVTMHFSWAGRLVARFTLFVGVLARVLIWTLARPCLTSESSGAKKLTQNISVMKWYLKDLSLRNSIRGEKIPRWARARPHIGIITSQDLSAKSDGRKKRSSVGTVYFMAEALRAHVGHVSYIQLNKPFRMKIGRLFHKLVRSLFKRSFDYEHSAGVARYYGNRLNKNQAINRCDVLYAPVAAAEIAECRTDVPLLYHSDATVGLLADYYPEYTGLMPSSLEQAHDVERAAIERATAIVYTTIWAARSAIETYGADGSRTHVIPYGANLDEVPRPVERGTDKRIDGCRLLFVGVNWLRKGGPVVMDTVSELRDRGIEAELVVCGCEIPDAPLPPYVTVIPYLDKNLPADAERLRHMYMDFDFLILPTRAESFGIVFCEAAAYGLPVITCATGGVPEVVIHEETGILLPTDAGGAEFASAIEEILQDESRYSRMSAASRQRYECELNWNTWAERMRPLVFELAGATSGVRT